MSERVNDGDRVIIRPGKDVVASMADAFRSEMLEAIASSRDEFIIDFSGVELVDSVGIGVIISAHEALQESNRTLRVINVTRDILGLFATMRLNRRFPVETIF
jgi:anti-sigma B factor antagonist